MGTETLPDLVPTRMLNEFAYCPRLAYLEWVQGEFAHSADTLDGALQHRRVDQPRGRMPEPQSLLKKDVAQASSPADGGAAAALIQRDAKGEPNGNKATAAANGGHDSNCAAIGSCPQTANTIHARSVELSAPVLGMIAVIDLLEAEDASALTPVDYKRGTVPENPEHSWEPERVQFCAQGLILRENGYRTDGGVIYYVASKTRVPIAFDETLVSRTRQLLNDLRMAAQSQVLPPPLSDSPKCPRCSLVGICLPDETRLLAEVAGESADGSPATTAPAAEPASHLHSQETAAQVSAASVPLGQSGVPAENVRPLVPARNDTRPLYVQEQGASVGKKGDTLLVRAPLGITLAEVRLAELGHVCLFGNVQISTQTLHELFDRQIPVAFFSSGGWFHGLALGLPSKNIEVRRRQFAAAADPTACLALARRLTAAKIENQRTYLRRNAEGLSATVLEELKRLGRAALQARSLPELLGLEGAAAKGYFAAFPGLLRPRQLSSTAPAPVFAFDFATRNRRPPTDPVNALLSYTYSLLAKDLTVACWLAGFDPFMGFYHQPRFGRPALALDLMEMFRPIIADSVVCTAINTGVVSPEDFLRRGPAVSLKPEGRKRFLRAYERRMDTLATHPIFGYQLSYRRILEVQVRLLGRTLFGELPAYPAFMVR